MSESYGLIVVQATHEILSAFNIHRDKGLEKLVAFSGADPAINDDCDVFFDELEIQDDAGCFVFENDYWLTTSKCLASTGKNIGLYLRIWDEYGGQYFLAQNRLGERYSFFAGGLEADFEDQSGDLVTEDKLKPWLAVIPENVKKKFPKLVDVGIPT